MAIGHEASGEVIDGLRQRLLDPQTPLPVKYRALFALRNLRGSKAEAAMVAALRDDSALFRHEVAYCLGQRQDPAAIPTLRAILRDPTEHSMVRHEAGEALGAIGTPECFELLAAHQEDPCPEVAQTCQLALQRIQHYAARPAGAAQPGPASSAACVAAPALSSQRAPGSSAAAGRPEGAVCQPDCCRSMQPVQEHCSLAVAPACSCGAARGGSSSPCSRCTSQQQQQQQQQQQGWNHVGPDTACSREGEVSPYLSVDPAPAAPLSTPTPALCALLLDEAAPIFERYRALFALRNKGGLEEVAALDASLGGASALLKHEVAYVLGQMQDPAAISALERVLRDTREHAMVRHEAAEALGSIADSRCQALLQEYCSDEEPIVAQSCIVALNMLAYEASGEFQYADVGLGSATASAVEAS